MSDMTPSDVLHASAGFLVAKDAEITRLRAEVELRGEMLKLAAVFLKHGDFLYDTKLNRLLTEIEALK